MNLIRLIFPKNKESHIVSSPFPIAIKYEGVPLSSDSKIFVLTDNNKTTFSWYYSSSNCKKVLQSSSDPSFQLSSELVGKNISLKIQKGSKRGSVEFAKVKLAEWIYAELLKTRDIRRFPAKQLSNGTVSIEINEVILTFGFIILKSSDKEYRIQIESVEEITNSFDHINVANLSLLSGSRSRSETELLEELKITKGDSISITFSDNEAKEVFISCFFFSIAPSFPVISLSDPELEYLGRVSWLIDMKSESRKELSPMLPGMSKQLQLTITEIEKDRAFFESELVSKRQVLSKLTSFNENITEPDEHVQLLEENRKLKENLRNIRQSVVLNVNFADVEEVNSGSQDKERLKNLEALNKELKLKLKSKQKKVNKQLTSSALEEVLGEKTQFIKDLSDSNEKLLAQIQRMKAELASLS